MEAIEEVVQQQPNNKYLKMFFDAHYVTFAKSFAVTWKHWIY